MTHEDPIYSKETRHYKDSRIQGFYWPLIGHRSVQAYFTYDTISPTWRTHDTWCFTFCSITVYMDNIRKPIHSFHHNRHYTDPKYSEGLSGVLNIKWHRDTWLSHNIPNCMKEVTWLMLCPSTNGHRSAVLEWLPFIKPPVFVQAAMIRSW